MTTKCPLDGYPLDIDTDWLGRTVARCVGCDRKRKDHCPDCGVFVGVKGKQQRCRKCRRAAKRVTNHRAYRRRRLAAGKRIHPSPGRCGGCATAIPVGQQKWCRPCARLQRRVWDRARYARDKAKRLAECRRRYWADPEHKRAGARANYRRNIVAIKRRRFKAIPAGRPFLTPQQAAA